MIVIEQAGADDIERLVALEADLFRDDAGRHDKFVDLTWPHRQGREDFARLVASPVSLVIVARDADEVIGHLVGYLSAPTPTRQPVTYAVLRSMYVEADHRRRGAGRLLTERFVS